MLMYYYSYSLVSLFFSSLYIYVSKYKHLLLMLLSLESVVLIFIIVYMFFSIFFWIFYFHVFFIYKSLWESFSFIIVGFNNSHSWESHNFNIW